MKLCKVLLSFAILPALGLNTTVLAKQYFIPARDSQALSEAIIASNLSPELDTIRLETGALYPLLTLANQKSELGLPSIRGKLIIEGNSAEIRRYSDKPMLLLHVARGAKLVISNLTLAEGSLGAIRNDGQLELKNVRIQDNVTRGSHAIVSNRGVLKARFTEFGFNEVSAAGAWASVITNYGELALRDCIFIGNQISTKHGEMITAIALLNYGQVDINKTKVEKNVARGEPLPFQFSTKIAAQIDAGKGSSTRQNWLIGDNENQLDSSQLKSTIEFDASP